MDQVPVIHKITPIPKWLLDHLICDAIIPCFLDTSSIVHKGFFYRLSAKKRATFGASTLESEVFQSCCLKSCAASLAANLELDTLQKINVLIKEKTIEKVVPSQELYPLKPGDVAKLVSAGIKKSFNISLHTKSWRHYNIRPPRGASDPSKCQSDYCFFDKAHHDYVYSKKWADFLISELSDSAKYDALCKL